MKKKTNSGQALLVILLIMAVALTIGLSVVSRSVTDIRLSQEQEESARAFSVAEAGLESLLAGQDLPDFSAEDFTIAAETISLGGSGKNSFRFPKEIDAGKTQTIWLIDHDETTGDLNPSSGFYQDGGTIEIFWGNEDQVANEPTTPALEATIIYNDGEFKTTKSAFDPDSNRTTSNNFTLASSGESLTIDDQTFTFPFKATVSIPSGSYALRLKLIYNDVEQALAIRGDADLPLQGQCYQVTASDVGAGISRKVEQCQLFEAPPAIFDYVLFSEEDLIKS
ncbi:MAG TPA: pilus assembly PilX N-terminal domain-containing protein [Patescibacteria group bacterium]|nr:pilus assembly PilX N-terminal domain-containing protein [Patescibacteria group bacterium]